MRVLLNLPIVLPKGTTFEARFDQVPRMGDTIYLNDSVWLVNKVFWPTRRAMGRVTQDSRTPPVVYLIAPREVTESEAIYLE